MQVCERYKTKREGEKTYKRDQDQVKPLTSVPELVNLTISTEGTASMTFLARVFSCSDGAPKEVPFSSVSCAHQEQHQKSGQGNAGAEAVGARFSQCNSARGGGVRHPGAN